MTDSSAKRACIRLDDTLRYVYCVLVRQQENLPADYRANMPFLAFAKAMSLKDHIWEERGSLPFFVGVIAVPAKDSGDLHAVLARWRREGDKVYGIGQYGRHVSIDERNHLVLGEITHLPPSDVPRWEELSPSGSDDDQ